MKIKQNRYLSDAVEFIGGQTVNIIGIITFIVPTIFFTVFYYKANINLRAVDLLIILAVITISILMVLFRYGLKVDTRSGEMIKWWGTFFIPLSSRKITLSKDNIIKIAKILHQTKNGSYYTYPVTIEVGESIKLGEKCEHSESRNFAETCAKIFEINILDATSEVEILRKFDEIDMSIRERAEKNEENNYMEDITEIPDSLKGSTSLHSNGTLHIKLENIAFNKVSKIVFILLGIIPVIMGLIFILPLILGSNKNDFIPQLFVFVIVLSICISLFLVRKKIISKFHGVTEIYSSKYSFSICYGPTKLEWASDEIEEFFLNIKNEIPSQMESFLKMFGKSCSNIVLRSDRKCISFGNNFTNEELEWIYKTLYIILTVRD